VPVGRPTAGTHLDVLVALVEQPDDAVALEAHGREQAGAVLELVLQRARLGRQLTSCVVRGA
jgi:hypothetical protein